MFFFQAVTLTFPKGHLNAVICEKKWSQGIILYDHLR